MVRRWGWVGCAAWLLGTVPASAQNWSFDARDISMGSVAGASTVVSNMIDAERGYRTILLPFGLLQVARDSKRLDPTSGDFDLLRAFEDASGPLHYTFGREEAGPADALVSDLRAARLSRDLTRYRGFTIADQPHAAGLAAPDWGVTYRFSRGPGGAYRGIYLGVGPYLSTQSVLDIDPRMVQILGSATPLYVPNVQLRSGTTTQFQGAVAGVIGYRARIALDNGVTDRDGVYLAANYRYLHGMRYENDRLSLSLDTDSAGLLTVSPRTPAPVTLDRWSSTAGQGRAFDLGVGAVLGGWSVDLGANGVGNRIDWRDLTNVNYTLGNPFQGNSTFLERPV